jgi:hypothetical protein
MRYSSEYPLPQAEEYEQSSGDNTGGTSEGRP